MPERNQAVAREESPTPVRSRLSFQRNPQASWTIERMLHRGQWGIPGLRGLTPISLSPDLKGLIISLSPGLKGFTVLTPVSNIKPAYEGSASPEDLTPIHMIRSALEWKRVDCTSESDLSSQSRSIRFLSRFNRFDKVESILHNMPLVEYASSYGGSFIFGSIPGQLNSFQ